MPIRFIVTACPPGEYGPNVVMLFFWAYSSRSRS